MKEEKQKKEKELTETKKIEKDAIDLNTKENELKKNEKMVDDAIKEVTSEEQKIKSDVDNLRLNEIKVEKMDEELEEKFLAQKQKEEAEKEAEAKRLKEEAEKERKEKLKNSCPASKVRTYVCNDEGFRLIKYFDYQYDFDENQCAENVKSKNEKCKPAGKVIAQKKNAKALALKKTDEAIKKKKKAIHELEMANAAKEQSKKK